MTDVGWFDRIADERIQQAQQEGLFDNLPGKGNPWSWTTTRAFPKSFA